ncbi:carboxymuconolactone decarboxylase family protein [Geobacter argillaceus]|nr:carboxymuconolactone decarboxylase family protein [Geobacter argillaceus]
MKLRASQINGCAYCIDMHSKEPGLTGKASSVSMSSTPGGKLPFTVNGKRRRWPGRKR